MKKWIRNEKDKKLKEINSDIKNKHELNKPRKSIDLLYDRLDNLMEDNLLFRSNSYKS